MLKSKKNGDNELWPLNSDRIFSRKQERRSQGPSRARSGETRFRKEGPTICVKDKMVSFCLRGHCLNPSFSSFPSERELRFPYYSISYILSETTQNELSQLKKTCTLSCKIGIGVALVMKCHLWQDMVGWLYTSNYSISEGKDNCV